MSIKEQNILVPVTPYCRSIIETDNDASHLEQKITNTCYFRFNLSPGSRREQSTACEVGYQSEAKKAQEYSHQPRAILFLKAALTNDLRIRSWWKIFDQFFAWAVVFGVIVVPVSSVHLYLPKLNRWVPRQR